ncbi:MAG: 6-phosphofructokinase, partial [Bacteroidia bacterium]|nr:6-phosphofructokinase [Bacteroidia bacterium]
RDTADSHTRLFFIEVMGRHSGYIALHTGIGSGAGTIFLPETYTSIEDFTRYLQRSSGRKKLFNLIIVAEGNKNGGAMELAKKVTEQFKEIDARATVIGHLQRGGSPTASDRFLASRLGYHAVKTLLDGGNNVAIGVMSNEITKTPLNIAIKYPNDPSDEFIEMAEVLAS